jgi:hypothetical protein
VDRRGTPKDRPVSRSSAERRHARSQAPYNPDPPSAAASGKPVLPGSIIDEQKTRDYFRRGLIEGASREFPPPYGDERLIAVAMSLGMPRWSADQMRYHPGLRLSYLGLCMDVEAAARGDKPAKARVDAVRARFVDERRAERIADVPNRATGYVAT